MSILGITSGIEDPEYVPEHPVRRGIDDGSGHVPEPLASKTAGSHPSNANGPVGARGLAGDHADDDGVYLDQLFTANPEPGYVPDPLTDAPVFVPFTVAGKAVGSDVPSGVTDDHAALRHVQPINHLKVRNVPVGGATPLDPVQILPADPTRTYVQLVADVPYRLAGDKGELPMCGSVPAAASAPLVIPGYTGPLWVDSTNATQGTVTVIAVSGTTRRKV